MLQPQHLSKAISKIMSDKRTNDRFKSVFSGIILVDGEFHSHCIIRDVSSTGMKLEIQGSSKELPVKFHVKTPEIPQMLNVILIWHKGKEIGVQLVSEEEFEAYGMEQENVA